MENLKMIPAKLSLRELNLGHGGNNVRWLNERESRLLKNSLDSLEKARKQSLSRIQQEMKGLHQERVTIHSVTPQLSNKTHSAESEEQTKRSTTQHSAASFHPFQERAQNTSDEERNSVTVADSKVEHMIGLAEVTNHQTPDKYSDKLHGGQGGWLRKHSHGQYTSPPKTGAEQPSNSEHVTTSTVNSSGPRRAISVTELPLPKEINSPRMRKKSVFVGEFHHTALTRSKSRSTDFLDVPSSLHSSTHPSEFRALSPSSVRKTSKISTCRSKEASPLFARRKLSPHHHQSPHASPPPFVRKISCPPKMSNQTAQQEEIIPLKLNHNNHGNASSHVPVVTDLPKIGISHNASQGHLKDDYVTDCACVSPLGLQEKVGNFLRSLEQDYITQEEQQDQT